MTVDSDMRVSAGLTSAFKLITNSPEIRFLGDRLRVALTVTDEDETAQWLRRLTRLLCL